MSLNSVMARRTSATGAPVTSHNSFSVTGSEATKRIDSMRLRRVGETTDRSLRGRRETDVVEERRLRVRDLAGANEFERRQKGHDDRQLFAAVEQLANRDRTALAHELEQ